MTFCRGTIRRPESRGRPEYFCLAAESIRLNTVLLPFSELPGLFSHLLTLLRPHIAVRSDRYPGRQPPIRQYCSSVGLPLH
jgi:hypothetical protein